VRKTYTENWIKLSNELNTYNGVIYQTSDGLNFTYNGIVIILRLPTYYYGYRILVVDPLNKRKLDISDYIPSLKSVAKYLKNYWDKQQADERHAQNLADKKRAEEILFGKKNEPQTSYHLQES
jgi:hypothetical protein